MLHVSMKYKNQLICTYNLQNMYWSINAQVEFTPFSDQEDEIITVLHVYIIICLP